MPWCLIARPDLCRPYEGSPDQPRRQVLQGARTAQYSTVTAAPPGLRAGRRVAAGTRIRGTACGLDHFRRERAREHEGIPRRHPRSCHAVRTRPGHHQSAVPRYTDPWRDRCGCADKQTRMVSEPHYITDILASISAITEIDFAKFSTRCTTAGTTGDQRRAGFARQVPGVGQREDVARTGDRRRPVACHRRWN